jgi:glutamate dehydrogenase/leucine dehydrogenase
LAPAIADVLACTRIHFGIAGAPTIQGYSMKIVVIGGTGLIGSKAVAILCQGGHEVVAASPKNGVNSITGEGLACGYRKSYPGWRRCRDRLSWLWDA